MKNQYVKQEDVDRYKKWFPKEPIDLVHFANFFSEGAVVSVSNNLFRHMEYDCHLEYDMYDWKHDCGMWKIVDDESGETVRSVECLWELAIRTEE